MRAEVYEAFRSIDVPEDKALRAAEAMTAHDPVIQQIGSDVRVLKWQVGAIVALLAVLGVPAILLLIRVAAKVGALS